MNALQRSLGFSSALALGFWLVSGCNSLIGADKPNHVASLGGAGGAAATCVLASDCPEAQICVFSQCSKQCAADKDCQFGRCLQTSAGNACVIPTSAVCKIDKDCPDGSQCKAKACRSSCGSNAECLTDQTCLGGACVGNDTMHDPSGGGGGAGGGGTTATGDSGAGGTAGEVESGGGMSGGGTAGSAGMAGTGGMSDGTAVGTLSATCDKEGALACAGHAQRSQLICQGGTWKTNGTCDGTSFCDTTPGANAGSCQLILAECAGKMAGDPVCRPTETDLRECGPDLVTAKVIQSCQFVCSAGACSGECQPGAKGCKPGNLIPQVCQDDGTQQDQPKCGYQCDPDTGKCIAAGCKDGVQNGDETDKDCGGSCAGCAIGSACAANADCVAPASAHCASLKCVAASCTDGIKNGDETGADCGGSCPGKCAVGVGCTGNGDCALPASGHCSSNLCVAPACNDGVLNGTETGKDCGGSCAADCPIGDGCGIDADCASGACLNLKCVVCKPTTKQCVAGPGFQTCSVSGAWGLTQSCSTVNGTPSCANGACAMTCSLGYWDCNAASVNDGCEENLNIAANCGTCAHTTSCTVPAFKCSAGTCVSNDAYPLGTTGGTDTAYPDNIWFAVPVVVPRTATLVALRLTAGASTPGTGQARLALWADDGTGHPGTLLAQGPTFFAAAGANSATPTPSALALAAGKTYWVAANFLHGVHIDQSASSGSVGYTFGQAFNTAPNMVNWAGAPSFNDLALSFYLYVQDVPP